VFFVSKDIFGYYDTTFTVNGKVIRINFFIFCPMASVCSHRRALYLYIFRFYDGFQGRPYILNPLRCSEKNNTVVFFFCVIFVL
jgi:hypothetical protein